MQITQNGAQSLRRNVIQRFKGKEDEVKALLWLKVGLRREYLRTDEDYFERIALLAEAKKEERRFAKLAKIRERRAKNKEAERAKRKAYREKNIEKMRAQALARYHKNKDKKTEEQKAREREYKREWWRKKQARLQTGKGEKTNDGRESKGIDEICAEGMV